MVANDNHKPTNGSLIISKAKCSLIRSPLSRGGGELTPALSFQIHATRQGARRRGRGQAELRAGGVPRAPPRRGGHPAQATQGRRLDLQAGVRGGPPAGAGLHLQPRLVLQPQFGLQHPGDARASLALQREGRGVTWRGRRRRVGG